MPFKFSWFCELLDELETAKPQQRATYSRQLDPRNQIVNNWYQRYSDHISRHGNPGVALLSALFPERRPDRTYNLQEKRLTQLVARVLGLGATRMRLLRAYERNGGPDFATCVERVMKETELSPRKAGNVTLEEIDVALNEVAAGAISSAPHIRALFSTGRPAWTILGPILLRLRSSEAKWLVRMIHKSYGPVDIPEYVALHGFHFMLPSLLKIQNSLEAATRLLARPDIARLAPRPAKEFEAALMPFMFKEILPELGIMVRRQPLEKARSIKHCVKIDNSRTMSVERKYDGEYCQIHVKVTRDDFKVQIFSKSGRDSTHDRSALLECIRIGLGLGTTECKIKERAILEGELVVYSTAEQVILPFYHIRKHVLHGGRRIGTALDSPKKSGEQLMIVFFDLLLLDNKPLINEPHRRRRQYLKAIVKNVDGASQVVERVIIDFSHKKAKLALRAAFSTSIRKRWEGFVIKGLEDAYFSWNQNARSIKFKKDYIAGLGDTADMCVIGGGRDSRVETGLNMGTLSWTFFYVACLLNKDDVKRHRARPHFRIVDRIGPGSMAKADIAELNLEAHLLEREFTESSPYMLIDQPRKDFPEPRSMFTKPIIVEIMGAGFERPQTVDFYVIRFPRKAGSKIRVHRDREVADTVSFDELQDMAEKSLHEQVETASQEEIEWIEKLEAADPKPRYLMEESQSTTSTKTPQSAATATLSATLSIRASTQPSPTLVRTDSEDLTPTELQGRYPDSAPQTPAPYSKSSTSPATIRRTVVLSTTTKRRISMVEDSPLYQSRKKTKVAFDARVTTARIPEQGPLVDMTNMWKRSDNTEQKTSTRGKANKSMDTNHFELAENHDEHTITSIKTAHGLLTPTSTAENTRMTSKRDTTVSGDNIKIRPTSRDVRIIRRIDPLAVLAYILPDEVIPRRRAEVKGPVWVAPSVLSRTKNDCHYKEEPEDENLAYNSLKEKMLESMVSVKKDETIPRYKFIVILDASRPELAVQDLRDLCEEILKFRNSEIEVLCHSDVLLFDYHVLGTRLCSTCFDFQHDRREDHIEKAEEHFLGTLEIATKVGADMEENNEYFKLWVDWSIKLKDAVSKGTW